MTLHVINGEKSSCFTSEGKEIVMTERNIVATTLDKLEFAEDAK